MKYHPLLQAFDQLADRARDRPLVVSAERCATIAAVDALAAAVCDRLRAAGIGRGATIGLIAPNGPGFLGALVGIRRSGGTVLLLDPCTARPEVDALASRFGLAAVLRCSDPWADSRRGWTIERRDPPRSDLVARPDVAVIKLTSASTGEPRGVATSEEALLADDEALTATMGILPEDRLLATAPLAHSYGLSSLVVPALVRGTSLVIPEDSGPFAPLRAAREAVATVFPTVPAYLSALLRLSEDAAAFGSIRLVISAGARLLPETAARFRERFGQAVHVFYGASECGGITYDRSGGAAENGTVGELVDGVRVRLEPVSGVSGRGVGRVVVRSPAVGRSYVPQADPRLDGERFVSDDLARLDGGALRLVGRLGNLIHVKGKKINPVEIERVIAEQESVEEVEVIGVPRPDSGDHLVRAVVACRPGSLTADELQSWCRDRLSCFKIPRSFVLVDSIPRNERGKVDRTALSRCGTRSATKDEPRA